MKNTFTNFEEYLLLFPKDVQTKLEALRKTVHAQTPELEEYIGYQMPAFRYKKKPWFTLLHTKITLDFIRFLRQLFILKVILKKENINSQKEQFSFL